MSLSSNVRIELSLLKLAQSSQAVSLALIRLGMALERWLDHAFNPNQPRVPAGSPDGGQWTDGDAAGIIPVADNDRPSEDRYLNQHIMDRHVGKSELELIARMERDTRHTLLGTRYMYRNGSFASKETARDFIRRTIEMFPETVSQVANGVIPDAFLTHRFGYETGREAYRNPVDPEIIQLRTTYNVGVLIIHDPGNPLGYRIDTAYPRNFNPRTGR